MDRKLVISELAEGMAQRVKMPQKEAEVFVRQFFDELSDNLFLENLVKVKGFGTFKLMDVDARESIDIHSGNRIQIAEHTKVSFLPDPVLRDAVNKPFLEFETVILNEGTDVEAMMAVEDPIIQDPPSDFPVREGVESSKMEETISVEEPVVDEPKVEEPVVDESMAEESVVEEPLAEEPMVDESFTDEPALDDPVAEEQAVEETINCASSTQIETAPSFTGRAGDGASSSRCFWHMVIACMCALLFFIIGYILGYLRPVALPFLENQPAEEVVEPQPVKKPQVKKQPKATKAAKPATPVTKAVTPSDSTAKSRPTKPQPSEALAYPQVEDGEYLIVGIKDTVVMKAGKTLLNISIQYYRSQDFVPYICKMNGITNPDIVPLDKELKIPELKHK